MVKIAGLVFFIAAVVGASRRDSNKTFANLQEIDTAANTLTGISNAWDGKAEGANDVVASANALVSLVEAANYDASEQAVISSEDSAVIVSYFPDTIEPDFLGAFNALVVHKANFDAAGASLDVLYALRDLKSKTDAFGTTLGIVISADHQDDVRAAIYQLDNDFSKIIDAFSE
ncbi:hydrophobic surface binding protein A-domain-containing protein [Truncatella angustata]|uniref:Hydrophobic surface binding protein A-domain-containing protein n=1 Tax=Truncatella angustata TaxID=152316 RepID=A0A9P9A0A6_9PEZI|nr:hydrophobic surface binding protein A-domain-containing protein [Truncatella angustata]KAH6655915.1 hydrophobic surface binding protein A-domain-containing protein [Truncatella angustata]KAH8199948.1 hypothetical protein TruAng_005887 [Truncatella angustata]